MACDIRDEGEKGKRQPGHFGLTVVSYTYYVVCYSNGLLELIFIKRESNNHQRGRDKESRAVQNLANQKECDGKSETNNQKKEIERKNCKTNLQSSGVVRIKVRARLRRQASRIRKFARKSRRQGHARVPLQQALLVAE